MSSQNRARKPEMAPIAWVFIAIFSSVLIIVALVYLYGLRLRHDKKKAQRRAENDEVFGSITANTISARKSFDHHQHA
ncbi:hypothetical protein LTR84_000458 [Exophiala bonariae]|uniref:Uncharacterized protein n=1 Tax=Exophiala bonariae TaxID=1690606 RepID=A0AAV9NSD9_9EURO|nr:hypothetical protein LTR84_000458 [Exophiala bonariae]